MGWVKNLCPRLEGKAGNMALLQKGKNKVNPEKLKKKKKKKPLELQGWL